MKDSRSVSERRLPKTQPAGYSRRAFLKCAGATALVVPLVPGATVVANQDGLEGGSSKKSTAAAVLRRVNAYQVRLRAAQEEFHQPLPAHLTNGDEDRFSNRIGSFSKGLPHSALGEVDPNAYNLYLRALSSGKPEDFEKIPLGCPGSGGYRLTNPQGGLAFDLEGIDAAATYQPPAPAFGSAELTGEIVENYWMALLRDVPFTAYESEALPAEAAADLSQMSDFKGPQAGGAITPGTLFRANLPGCAVGPYVSQFMWMAMPFGVNYVESKMKTTLAGVDFMTTFADWLSVQNGCRPGPQPFESLRRYVTTGRDLAQWVHIDVLHQAYFQAMLSMLHPSSSDAHQNGLGAPFNPSNPYLASASQEGFTTFGAPHIASLLPEVATRALKAVWFQKWFVHRRLRPEVYAARIHNYLTGQAEYPVSNPDLDQTRVLERLFTMHGTYLLPMAFAEGSPLHPAYGAGHATVAGACVTILKAFFDESFVIPAPVQAATDGQSLVPYTGPGPLTVGGELNKIAANVSMGRNIAGVHWRSDAVESLKLGEAVAISVLRDQRHTYNEAFGGWTFTGFEGTQITV